MHDSNSFPLPMKPNPARAFNVFNLSPILRHLPSTCFYYVARLMTPKSESFVCSRRIFYVTRQEPKFRFQRKQQSRLLSWVHATRPKSYCCTKMSRLLCTCIIQSHLQIHCIDSGHNFHCLSVEITFNVHQLRRIVVNVVYVCTSSTENCLMSRKIDNNFWTVISGSLHIVPNGMQAGRRGWAQTVSISRPQLTIWPSPLHGVGPRTTRKHQIHYHN